MAVEVSYLISGKRLRCLAYGKRFVRYNSFEGEIGWDLASAVLGPFDVFLAFLEIKRPLTLGPVVRLFVEQNAHFPSTAQVSRPCEEEVTQVNGHGRGNRGSVGKITKTGQCVDLLVRTASLGGNKPTARRTGQQLLQVLLAYH